jgi:hypothetical protein
MPEGLRLAPPRPGKPVDPVDVPEVLVISALLEAGMFTPADYSLSIEQLACWEQLWQFATEYQASEGKAPPLELVLTKWPDFPYLKGIGASWAAEQLHKAAHEREIRRTIRGAAQALANGGLEEAFSLLSEQVKKPLRLKAPGGLSVFDESNIDDLERRRGWPVPWASLMKESSGLVRGELWYLGARTGEGKSQVLPAIAVEAAAAGARVRYASLEMPMKAINRRILRLMAAKDPTLQRQLFSPDREMRLRALKELERTSKGFIDTVDPSVRTMTTTTIEDLANDVDLVFIDHVGLMQDSRGRRSIEDWRVAAEISNVLKELAVARNVGVVAAAQVNREGDTNSPNPPKISNLSQTTALEQDGDVVVMMKRFSPSTLVYQAGKVREGRSVKWYGHFNPERGNFAEISRDEAERIKLEDDDRSGDQ